MGKTASKNGIENDLLWSAALKMVSLMKLTSPLENGDTDGWMRDTINLLHEFIVNCPSSLFCLPIKHFTPTLQSKGNTGVINHLSPMLAFLIVQLVFVLRCQGDMMNYSAALEMRLFLHLPSNHRPSPLMRESILQSRLHTNLISLKKTKKLPLPFCTWEIKWVSAGCEINRYST